MSDPMPTPGQPLPLPNDKLIFDLVQRIHTDNPAILAEVKRVLEEVAAKSGVTVSAVGEIDPKKVENPERAAEIAGDAGKKMDARTFELEAVRTTVTVQVGGSKKRREPGSLSDRQGTSVEVSNPDDPTRRKVLLSETKFKLSIDLTSLVKLADKMIDLGSACVIGIATKVGKAVADRMTGKK